MVKYGFPRVLICIAFWQAASAETTPVVNHTLPDFTSNHSSAQSNLTSVEVLGATPLVTQGSTNATSHDTTVPDLTVTPSSNVSSLNESSTDLTTVTSPGPTGASSPDLTATRAVPPDPTRSSSPEPTFTTAIPDNATEGSKTHHPSSSSPSPPTDGDLQEIQMADHVLQAELALVHNSSNTELKNTSLIVVRNGTLIVGEPTSGGLHENSTSEATPPPSTEPSNITQAITEPVNETSPTNSTATVTFSTSTVVASSPAISPIDRENASVVQGTVGDQRINTTTELPTTTVGLQEIGAPANISELLDRAVRRQFCRLSVPSPDVVPRCSWKSIPGQQMDFWPAHIDVSLCVAFVEKLEQCQALCEGQQDQCQSIDFCPPCVDYNCRLFKEPPGGPSGLKLSNALSFVDFHEKITCANDVTHPF